MQDFCDTLVTPRVAVPVPSHGEGYTFADFKTSPLRYACGTMRAGTCTVTAERPIAAGTLYPCLGRYLRPACQPDSSTSWFYPARLAPSDEWHVDGSPEFLPIVHGPCSAPYRIGARGLAWWAHMREPTPEMMRTVGYVRAIDEWWRHPFMSPLVEFLSSCDDLLKSLGFDGGLPPLSFLHIVDDVAKDQEIVVTFNLTDPIGRRLYYATPHIFCSVPETLLLFNAAPYSALLLVRRLLDAQTPDVRASYVSILSSHARSSSAFAAASGTLLVLADALRAMSRGNIPIPVLPIAPHHEHLESPCSPVKMARIERFPGLSRATSTMSSPMAPPSPVVETLAL